MQQLRAACALIALIVATPALANTFRIDATEDVGYLAVQVSVAAVTNVVVIRISNDDPLPVYCSVTLDMGPDEGRRRVRVDAGESRTVSYAVRRTMTQKVVVHTRCTGDLDDEDDARDARDTKKEG